MAAAKYMPITATGTYQHFPDWQQTPFDLSWQMEVPPGTTISYTVAYSLDDAADSDPTFPASWTPMFFPDPTFGTSQSGSVHGGYGANFAIQCLQITVTSLSGVTATNPPRLVVIQGSSAR